MKSNQLLLAIDQGTTSSRAIVFDTEGNIVSVAQEEFPQIYPDDGWVEHDPEAIWSSTLAVSQQAMTVAEGKGGKIAAIGITNQRETTIIWDKETGKPIYNAIVWQDRRTADTCQSMKEQGHEEYINERTGLLLDPYFSATKVAWILDNVTGAREMATAGQLAFGTIDSFLIWRLTGGKLHATDVTNASRTNLFNIHTLEWDPDLLRLFNIPDSILPEVKACADDYGVTKAGLLDRQLPILGVAGDQQAATIGQCCFNRGDIKSTFGTGCFVMLNTGTDPVKSKNKLLTTIAYQINGETHYALEGSVFVAGAAIQWLRDGLGIIKSAAKTEEMARGKDGNDGVYLVPAFTGLGAPHWEPHARGTIFGLSRATGPDELVRATLESVCYQTRDLLHAMNEDGISPERIRVDGGMVANDWLMQFLSDILELDINRPHVLETTALGAAYLAGIQSGIYKDIHTLSKLWQQERLFTPEMDDAERDSLIDGWNKAVDLTLAWAKN